MARFSVFIPVGPDPRELPRLLDTVESLFAFERDVSRLLIIDDVPEPRHLDQHLREHCDLPGQTELIVIVDPVKSNGPSPYARMCLGTLAACERLADAKRVGDAFTLKLDTDALVVAPFSDAIAERFARDASAGLLGLVRTNSDGTRRDLGVWPTTVRRLGRRLHIAKSDGRPAVRQAFLGERAVLRRYVRDAMARGYVPGESVLGGAYAVRPETLAALHESRALAQRDCWRPFDVSEDVALSILTCRAGFTLVDANRRGEPFGVAHVGLPFDPPELLARGHALVHSTRNHPGWSEDDVRQFFCEQRRRGNPPASDKPVPPG